MTDKHKEFKLKVCCESDWFIPIDQLYWNLLWENTWSVRHQESQWIEDCQWQVYNKVEDRQGIELTVSQSRMQQSSKSKHWRKWWIIFIKEMRTDLPPLPRWMQYVLWLFWWWIRTVAEVMQSSFSMPISRIWRPSRKPIVYELNTTQRQ